MKYVCNTSRSTRIVSVSGREVALRPGTNEIASEAFDTPPARDLIARGVLREVSAPSSTGTFTDVRKVADLSTLSEPEALRAVGLSRDTSQLAGWLPNEPRTAVRRRLELEIAAREALRPEI